MDALRGIRILDLADEPAVFATRILADLGADVVRVEHPDGGSVRALAPFLDGEPGAERSFYHLYHNANKRSVTLDIARAPGADLLRRLATRADVLVESHMPGAMAALGLGYDDVRVVNPRIIYVSVTPFGQQGAWRGRRANDLVAAAASGLLHLTGEADGPPVQGAADPAHKMASLVTASGIMIALAGRDADPQGTGAHLDISVQECARLTLVENANPSQYLWTGRIPQRSRVSRVFQCRDGRWAGMNTRPDRFGAFLDWVKEAGLDTDLDAGDWEAAANYARPAQRARVRGLAEGLAAKYPRAEFMTRAWAAGQMCLPVLQLAEMRDEDHLRLNRQFLGVEHEPLGHPLEFPRSPVDVMAEPVTIRRAPTLGEHNADVYGELGLAAGDLRHLRELGVI